VPPDNLSIKYFLIGDRPVATARRPDGSPYKAIGYEFESNSLKADATLFLELMTHDDVDPITEVEFNEQLQTLGCSEPKLVW
jgi:hypothetical protein